MPFLAGGYHLSIPAKIAITNSSFLLMAVELTDEDASGDWLEAWQDAGSVFQFAGTVYILWVPPVVQAGIAARIGLFLAPVAMPAAIITSMIIVGGVVSYAIDPEEGLKNYKDFLTQPTKIPERLKFTAETIYEEKIDPAVNMTLGVAAMLYRMTINEVERRITVLEEGVSAAVEFVEDLPGIWLNPTPGYRLF